MKALINEKNPAINVELKRILSSKGIDFDDYVENVGPSSKYSLVFVGLGVNDSYAEDFLEFASNITKLVIVILHNDRDDLRRTCIKNGAYSFVEADKIGQNLEILLDKIIAREGSAKKYSKKVLSAMNSFLGTSEEAFKMVSLARLLCFKYRLSADNLKLVERAVELLAVTFKVENTEKVVELFRKLDINSSVLDIVESKRNLGSVIAYAILYYVRSKNSLVSIVDPLMSDKKLFEDVFSSIKKIDEKNAYMAIDYEDYELLKQVMDKYIDIRAQIDLDEKELLKETASEIVFHNSMYHFGSRVLLQEDKIRIEPLDGKIIARCKNLIKESIWDGEGFDKKILINIEDNKAGYTLRLRKIDTEIEPEPFQPIESSQQKEPAEPMQTIDMDAKMSAEEFCSKYPMAKEDNDTLEELEEDILSILDSLHFHAFDAKVLKEINSFLYKYASSLVYYYELSNLSNALMELTRYIENVTNSENVAEFGTSLYLIEGLIASLREWREVVLAQQSAKDINYLDSSFKADCEQIFGHLGEKKEEEEEGELELF